MKLYIEARGLYRIQNNKNTITNIIISVIFAFFLQIHRHLCWLCASIFYYFWPMKLLFLKNNIYLGFLKAELSVSHIDF